MSVENPYKPPAAAVRDPPRPPRSPIVAVLAGLAVDIGGTTVAGIVLGIVYAAMLAARGMGAEEIGTTLTELEVSGYFILSTVVRLGFSALGGYVCARMARRDERRLTAIMAGLVVAIGFAMGAARWGVGLNVLMLVLTFAVVIAGGELARRRNVADARKTGAGAATAG